MSKYETNKYGLTFDGLLAAVADGATIGGCADIMIGEEFVGYLADDTGPEYPADYHVNPLRVRARPVFEDISVDDGYTDYGRQVWVPCHPR